MPELPEVEVLVRHLAPLLTGRTVRGVSVQRKRVIRPDTRQRLARTLVGARFVAVERRAKFLVFQLQRMRGRRRESIRLLGHLGMTGRMYLLPSAVPLPRHAAVTLDLGRTRFVYEDRRYFGRFTTDLSALDRLGEEPLSEEFTVERLAERLKRSSRSIKVRIMDQAVVAGIGNIYASEALFRAGIPPRKPARQLTRPQVNRLHAAIRVVLREAIDRGSTIPLDFDGTGRRDGLFYHGVAEGGSGYQQECLLVYDREGDPCTSCGRAIKRIVQAARSTYYCAACQRN